MLHRGKIATNPEILESRPLTRDDLSLLRQERGAHPTRAGSGHIEKLRGPHHRLARLIAAGLRYPEIVARSGYSYGRIKTLEANASFQEIIAGYRQKIDEAYVEEVQAQEEYSKTNAVVAARMISEALEEHDEQGTRPSIKELMLITTDGMDRFGYPKLKTTIHADAGEFAKRMEEAIARTKTVRVIEARPASALPQSPSVQPSVPAVEAAPSVGRLRRI